MKYVYKDILAILFLFCCCLVFLSQLFIHPQIFSLQDSGQGDITHLYYPQKNFYADELKAGRFPLWTNYIATGFPLVATGQVGPFFLPNIILYYLLPVYLAFNISYLITFLIASIGMYFYCRYLGLSIFASLFSSIGYAFSFIFIGHIFHVEVIQSFSFLPWLLLVADRLLVTGSRKYLILFALLLQQQYFAGFIQGTVYVVIGVFMLTTFRYFKKPNFSKHLVLLFFACVLAFGMAAIQILPTVELSTLSTRNGFSSLGFNFPYTIKDLAYFIYPYLWGNPATATYVRNLADGLFWENNIYAGLLPFFCLLLSFFLFNNVKKIRPYVYLFFISLFFSLGWIFFLYSIPPFSMFREPQRALFITIFAYAVLAGFGFDEVIRILKKKISTRYFIGAFCLLTICLTFIDLFFYNQKFISSIPKDEWLKTPDTANYLKSQNLSGRVFTLGNYENWMYIYNNVSHGWTSENADKLLSTRALLHPDSNMLYGIPAYYEYAGFRTQNKNLMNALIFAGLSSSENIYKIATNSAKLLGMEGVQYILSPGEIVSDPDDLQLVWKKYNEMSRSIYSIYENKQFVERIHPIKELRGELSLQQMQQDLLDSNFSPKDTAYILDFNSSQSFSDKVSITDIKEEQQNINFSTTSNQDAFIVIADSYYPGWHARIDGNENTILNVNINSRGLLIPSGRHKIKMYYDPLSYKLGKTISFLTLLALLAVCVAPMIIKYRKHN